MLVSVCVLMACGEVQHEGREYSANGTHRHIFEDANGGSLVVEITEDNRITFWCSPGFHGDRAGVRDGTRSYRCKVNPEPRTLDVIEE